MKTYRSDVVGSLLRPAYLAEARRDVEGGRLDPAAFKRVEDRAVDEAIALQEQAGLDVITDGELRRYAFFGHLIEALDGFDKLGGWAIPFRNEQGEQLVFKRPVVVVGAALATSRLGLGITAIREDEDAAEASGVNALGLKLTALVTSTGLAALAGGLFAYYHISYYPQHPFSPHWTFDALLITYIGGVGTLHGPVLGAVFYVVLEEYLATRWVDLHLLIFGALFIVIVLLLPGGFGEAGGRLRRLVRSRLRR